MLVWLLSVASSMAVKVPSGGVMAWLVPLVALAVVAVVVAACCGKKSVDETPLADGEPKKDEDEAQANEGGDE